jgi:adenylate kinase
MDAIILLGGPGAGKGTLAEALKKETAYIHVSTGDMLRAAIRSGSPLGREAKLLIDDGNLVSDDMILQVIKERIGQESADAKFMFDGFPRTLEQAQAFRDLCQNIGGTVTHVLALEVEPDVLIHRICGRRTCKTCGAIFHIENMPPKEDGVCDLDGGELYQRADDNEETVIKRLEIYNTQTAPLIDFYTKAGILHVIDAGCPVKDVHVAALSLLNT